MRLHRNPLLKPYLALLAICFFWGTTYLAIRMSLEAIPPMVLVSGRFILSGSILLLGAVAARAKLPQGSELRKTAVNGVLILGIGNSCLSVAELWIPSGLAALIVTTSPFWMVGIDALLPGGERLRMPTVAGILVGCIGAVILIAPQALGAGQLGKRLWWAFLLLQFANFSWSFGSIRQTRIEAQAHPIVNGAVQQLSAGLAFLPLALLEAGSLTWQPRAYLAALYLVIFGSIVGYSAYVYALEHLPVALVSIYTYVNPIVAVWLGWLVYREPFGKMEIIGMAVIFVGVALVKHFSRKPAAPELD